MVLDVHSLTLNINSPSVIHVCGMHTELDGLSKCVHVFDTRVCFQEYDACNLVKKYNGPPMEILVDQGKADNFFPQGQLLPDNLVAACAEAKVPVILRMQDGYDHSYYFIATFMGEHIAHHAKALNL